MRNVLCFLLGIVLLAGSAGAQQVDVVEHRLDNGLTLLLVPRPGDPNVAAGWIAKVGSVYERPGITGVAHLFEHMMFKGTRTIGTRDIEQDLQIIEQLDEPAGRDTGRGDRARPPVPARVRSTIRPIPRCAAPGTRSCSTSSRRCSAARASC